MKAEIKVTKEIEIKTVSVCLPVRYENEDIPFDAPLRDGDLWQAKIDLDNGCIIGWPKGEKLNLHMKVCDEGIYHLLDENDNIVLSKECYVPNDLIPPSDGYGDYVRFDINENGTIMNWYSQPSIKEFTQPDED